MVRLCDLPEYREVKNVNPFSSSASKDTAAEQAKNHFASNFTSAAILKADDGVNWTTQTQTDEQKKAAAAATTRRDLVGDGTRKTLYDQLQENKEKWQEEFDENTKKIYAPPKALDEEDVQFFDEQYASQKEKERLKKEQALVDLLDFKSAQNNRVVKAAPKTTAPAVAWTSTSSSSPKQPTVSGVRPKPGLTPSLVAVLKPKKRKSSSSDGKSANASNTSADGVGVDATKKKKQKKKKKKHAKASKSKGSINPSAAAGTTAAPSEIGNAFAMYGSSSDEDSD